jgi:hypothetical protein
VDYLRQARTDVTNLNKSVQRERRKKVKNECIRHISLSNLILANLQASGAGKERSVEADASINY